MNDDSPTGVASAVREGVTPSVIDMTVEMGKQNSLDDTTVPGSFPPLSTSVSTTAGNVPGESKRIIFRIQKRSRADPTLLNDFKMAAEGKGDPPVPDLQTMEELCQPSLKGRVGPISPISIQATNVGLKNDMIQQGIKVNGVTDDALRLYLFPHSLTHHATAWFDHLPRNSINTFEQMAKMFLGKYFPPSMVTKLRNEITNFRQRPDESLFEAWERYKLSIDRWPNHNMLPVTQIDTFYNGLTLRHRDTINAAAGGTFMKRHPEECYDLIENMTAHHNDWDTSAQQSESSSSITSSFDPEIVALKAEMAEINKNLMRVLQPLLAKLRTYMLREPTKVGSETLLGNTITNLNEDLKGITTRSVTEYQGPTIPTTSSSLPQVVERETEVTKDTMPPTNNRSTKDVQPSIVQTKIPILNSEPVVVPLRKCSYSDANVCPTIKTLLTNKDKLSELARTPLNEHCSAVLLKKLPEKLGDPGKFLIPCDFLGMDECLALADLGASINLMPLSVWNKLYLPELSPTCMTLKLADRSISRPVGVAEDVFAKVGTFHFQADFVVVDFDADPRVPLIIGRSFLKTERALIDVFEANYNDMTANRIYVIDVACEEYSQEVLGFSDVIAKVDAFLALEDDATSPKVYHSYFDPEGDILLLEAFLNDDPSLLPPNQGNYMPQVRKELKICKAKTDKSSIDEPPEVELKDLPPHLEYTFLEGDDKLPVIIAKDLSDEKKTALITVLKSHKRAIAWKLSDIKDINLEFYTHKILMEDDFEPMIQHQIRGGFTVVGNEENELIPTRLVTGWRVCIDYRKLNEATRKDHFPLPFIDQMLERLAGNEYYCFLDGFMGHFQIPIDPKDQEKTTFTCPYERLPTVACLLAYAMHRACSKGV
nr:reverse transcriptase domain-containing protein [Tanacetum cinerariifolium]